MHHSNTALSERIHGDFSKQGFMHTLGARLLVVEDGRVAIQCDFRESLAQQHGYFHAGVITTIADVACGYAAYTQMPAHSEVLTVEFKINFIRPAKTTSIKAEGVVLRSGRTLTISEGTVYDTNEDKIIAKMTATLICLDK